MEINRLVFAETFDYELEALLRLVLVCGEHGVAAGLDYRCAEIKGVDCRLAEHVIFSAEVELGPDAFRKHFFFAFGAELARLHPSATVNHAVFHHLAVICLPAAEVASIAYIRLEEYLVEMSIGIEFSLSHHFAIGSGDRIGIMIIRNEVGNRDAGVSLVNCDFVAPCRVGKLESKVAGSRIGLPADGVLFRFVGLDDFALFEVAVESALVVKDLREAIIMVRVLYLGKEFLYIFVSCEHSVAIVDLRCKDYFRLLAWAFIVFRCVRGVVGR